METLKTLLNLHDPQAAGEGTSWIRCVTVSLTELLTWLNHDDQQLNCLPLSPSNLLILIKTLEFKLVGYKIHLQSVPL